MSGRLRAKQQITVVDAEADEDAVASRPGRPPGGETYDWTGRDEEGTAVAAKTARHSGPLRVIRHSLKLLLPLAVIAGAYSVYSYLIATAPEPHKRAPVERTYNVTTVIAQPGSYKPLLKLYGTTTAGRRVDIRALVAGQVIGTGGGLREGGEVQKGEALLSIDPFDYKSAKLEAAAQLTEARAKLNEMHASMASEKSSLNFARQQLKLAQKDLDRAVPLARRGTVSSRTVDDRRNIVIQRRQSVEQLGNNIRVWEARIAQQGAAIERLASATRRAQRQLERTKLVAPFNAYVMSVDAQVGRMLSANDKVATLIDRDWIEVRVTLTDSQYGRIMAAEKSIKGRKVDVHWKVGSDPLIYSATINRVGAEIASDSGGVAVYARIDDPLRPVPLRSGAFVEVLVPDTTFTDVYRLPHTAIYNGDKVYVVVKGRLKSRKVRAVGTLGGDILVSGALTPGERVITTRLSTPGDGVKVQER